MADRDKDGVEDSVDIDGGNGTNKAPSKTPLTEAQYLAGVEALIKGAVATNGGGSSNANAGTNVSTSKIKLTNNSALALMKLAAAQAGYTGLFTPKDIAQFIKEFNAEQALQIEKVVTTTTDKTVPGGAGGTDKTTSSSSKVETPSFFDAGQFTSDWVWGKVNFGDEKTLGSKSLGILAQVRGLVDKFNIFGVDDNKIRDAAKQIAMGKTTLADYTVELQKFAAKEYPQFADRFAKDPTLTTYDIASPIVKMLAKTWEVPEESLNWKTNPLVMSYTNFAGPDGKGTPPSYYDLLLKAKKDPKYQLTQQANEDARDAATGLARAFGFGV